MFEINKELEDLTEKNSRSSKQFITEIKHFNSRSSVGIKRATPRFLS